MILEKKKIFLLCLMSLVLFSCSDDIFDHAQNSFSTSEVSVSLTGIDALEGINIQLRNTTTNSVFTQQSDAAGKATFTVTPGLYEVTATGSSANEGIAYTYNGMSGQITVKNGSPTMVSVAMKSARTSQIVIKEIYNGGCLADDGVTTFQFDKCIILYNNSSQKAVIHNLCIGEGAPSNGQATNRNYDETTGKLVYEDGGFIPVWHGIWYFPSVLEIEPYSQVVVNVNGAIDNTKTISQSVDYANADYYCMYDPESGYTNTKYYPTPASVIPTSHYLKAVELGLGNGWPLSVSSPAIVIFQTKDVLPADYAKNTANHWYDGGEVSQVKVCVKVPADWIVDATEVFSSGYKDSSVKRLTADVDAGYVWLTNYRGHTLYRNVDKAATEALPENEGKLVYQYSLGFDGSTDPSGIDAEASMKKGAHVIFQDTNNSSNDFHERKQCSLRD